MSTKYKDSDKVPTAILAKRLDELSDAVVARMNRKPEVFEREFTCRIPAELDRDADLVLAEASNRLLAQQEDNNILRLQVQTLRNMNETQRHNILVHQKENERLDFEHKRKSEQVARLKETVAQQEYRLLAFANLPKKMPVSAPLSMGLSSFCPVCNKIE